MTAEDLVRLHRPHGPADVLALARRLADADNLPLTDAMALVLAADRARRTPTHVGSVRLTVEPGDHEIVGRDGLTVAAASAPTGTNPHERAQRITVRVTDAAGVLGIARATVEVDCADVLTEATTDVAGVATTGPLPWRSAHLVVTARTAPVAVVEPEYILAAGIGDAPTVIAPEGYGVTCQRADGLVHIVVTGPVCDGVTWVELMIYEDEGRPLSRVVPIRTPSGHLRADGSIACVLSALPRQVRAEVTEDPPALPALIMVASFEAAGDQWTLDSWAADAHRLPDEVAEAVRWRE